MKDQQCRWQPRAERFRSAEKRHEVLHSPLPSLDFGKFSYLAAIGIKLIIANTQTTQVFWSSRSLICSNIYILYSLPPFYKWEAHFVTLINPAPQSGGVL